MNGICVNMGWKRNIVFMILCNGLHDMMCGYCFNSGIIR